MLKRHPLPHFAPSANDPCFCRSGRAFGSCCGSQSEHRKPPAGVLVYPGFVDPDTCRKWVSRLEKQPRERSPVNVINRPGTGPSSDQKSELRVCTDVKPGVLRKVINGRVAEAFKLTADKTRREVAWFEMPTILRYRSGGYYLRHADSCLVDPASNIWVRVHDRDLSLLIYLNEDFTGGGISFINFNYTYKPRAGDLLAFPSDNRYEHQAEVVKSGIRYVIVSWAALEGSQRVLDHPPRGAVHLG